MSGRQQYQLGMSAYNAGRYAEAIEHLLPLASNNVGATALLSRFYLSQSHHHLAIELFKARRFQDATIHFQAAAQANPSGGGFARFLAVCHVGTGRLDLAAREFESILCRNPEDSGVRIRFALTLWKQGNPLAAITTLREGLLRRSDDAELNYQLGVMLAADEETAEAEALFEKAVALDSMHAGALERLAQCCALDNRCERAWDYLRRAHRAEPGNARILLQLSLLAPAMGERGRTMAGEIIELDGAAQPHTIDDADIDRLGETIVNEPDFCETFLSLPSSEVDHEVFSTLAATLERALQKYPEYADLHYHCGAVYRRLDCSEEAIRHAERAVQRNPRFIKALILLAELYGQTDRWVDGLERLEQAIRAGGDYPDVHYLLGRLAQKGGQLERARSAYERALALNDRYQAARDALGSLSA